MKSLQDAFYNWLSIKVVSDARPLDVSAVETTELFATILRDEHGVSNIAITKDDERWYFIDYVKDGEQQSMKFPIDLIDVMLKQIEAEPEKFKIFPEE
ncbi:hypothetical protein [Bacillus marasmi]|uniref:hypothetical protein n=1 Tax=Bacillus marasmi TaxID=1926279 RepID=UPI0011CA1044|nr:hypothetical protein [Bacillus marasmi]